MAVSKRLTASEFLWCKDCVTHHAQVVIRNGIRLRQVADILCLRSLFAFVVLLLVPGCGYMVGGNYDPQVRTVAVPVFGTEDFRSDFHIELTEFVQREIQSRTPYLISDAQSSDTRLKGRILEVRKDVLAEDRFDDPRQLQLSIAIEVVWEDLRNGRILASRQFPVDGQTAQLISHRQMAPEIGQSLATAKQAALKDLSTQIVNMMESPW